MSYEYVVVNALVDYADISAGAVVTVEGAAVVSTDVYSVLNELGADGWLVVSSVAVPLVGVDGDGVNVATVLARPV